jgi:hypothetical protein
VSAKWSGVIVNIDWGYIYCAVLGLESRALHMHGVLGFCNAETKY